MSAVDSNVDAGMPLEATDSSGGGLEVERRSSGDFINALFYPAKMDLFKQSRTIDLLLTRLKECEMDLSPDFKRRANLWNEGGKNGRCASVLALTAGLGSCQTKMSGDF